MLLLAAMAVCAVGYSNPHSQVVQTAADAVERGYLLAHANKLILPNEPSTIWTQNHLAEHRGNGWVVYSHYSGAKIGIGLVMSLDEQTGCVTRIVYGE